MDETYQGTNEERVAVAPSFEARIDAQLAVERELALDFALAKDEARRRRKKLPVEAEETKKLKRDLRREALTRLEDAAQTEEDFLNILSHWDHLDENAARRVRYHEVQRDLIPLEYKAKSNRGFWPEQFSLPRWRQVMRGNFLDVIYHCPFDIHEVPTYAITSSIIQALKPEQKILLFYLTVGECTTEQLAKSYELTDRNIHKRKAVILKKLRKKILAHVAYKFKNDIPTTARERRLVEVFSGRPVDGYPYL